MELGPGPRSIWMPKGRKKTTRIVEMAIINEKYGFMRINDFDEYMLFS